MIKYIIAIILLVPFFANAQNKIIIKVPYLPVYLGGNPAPAIDSTQLIAGYGVLINESPANTWTIKSDTNKVATLYDLSLVDQSSTNEIQVIDTFQIFNINQLRLSISQDNQPAKVVTLPSGGSTETVSEGYGINVSQVGNNYTVAVDTLQIATTYDLTLVDQSSINELQTLSNSGNVNTHTITLSNGGGKSVLKEGDNITLTTNIDTVTISANLPAGSIDGTGLATRPAFWQDANTLTYDNEFDWDNTNKKLILGTGSSRQYNRFIATGTPANSNPIAVFENKYTGVGATNVSLFFANSTNLQTALNVNGSTSSTLLNYTLNSGTGNVIEQSYVTGINSDAYHQVGKSGSGLIWSYGMKQSSSYAGRFTISEGSGLSNTTERLSIGIGGIVRLKSLDTDATAPVTSGTTKMVISDANGDLSFTNIPTGGGSGIDSTNIIGGWGIDAVESPANTFNIIADTTQVATLYDLTLLDQSSTNELQTLSHTNNSTSHTVTLSNSGGSLILTEGTNVNLSSVGNNVTISSTGTTETLNEGYGININQTGNNYNVSVDTLQVSTPYDLSLVDQSATNELQTLTNSSNSTSHTVTLSNSGGNVTFTEGANITLTTAGNNVTIAATSTIGSASVSEGYGINVVQNGSDYNVAVDTTQVATPFDLTQFITGSGTSTRPAFWTASKNLSSDAEFDWDNTNKILKLGTGATNTAQKLLISSVPVGTANLASFEHRGNGTNANLLDLRHVGTSSEISLIRSQGFGTNATVSLLQNNDTQFGSSIYRNLINSSFGDAYYVAGRSGVANWSFGFKQSDSYGGKFTLSYSNNLSSTNEMFSMSTGGIARIKSLQTGLTAPSTSGTTKMVITDANGDLSFANLPSSQLTGTGSANYMTYWQSTTNLSSTAISYGTNFVGLGFGVVPSSVTHAIHINNDALRLQGTSTIIDKFNSGGALNYVLSGTGGNGVEWKSLSSLGVDMSTSNEIQNFSFQPKVGSSVGIADDLGSSTYKFTEGSNISLTRSPGGQELIIASTGGTTDLTFTGTTSPYTLNSSSGSDVTITQGTNVSLTRVANDLQINAANTNLSVGGSNSTYTFNSSTGNDVTITGFNGVLLGSLTPQNLDIGLTGNALALHNLPTNNIGFVVKNATGSNFTTRLIDSGEGIIVQNANGSTTNPTIHQRNAKLLTLYSDVASTYSSASTLSQNSTGNIRNGQVNTFTYTSSPLAITVNETGTYIVNFSGNVKAQSSGGSNYIAIRKNGVIVAGSKRYVENTFYQTISYSNFAISCSANDVIDVYVDPVSYNTIVADYQLTFQKDI